MQSDICVGHLQGECPAWGLCTSAHHYWPWMWKIRTGHIWNVLKSEGPGLEVAYCDPKNTTTTLQTVITNAHGETIPISLCVSFCHMQAKISAQPPNSTPDTIVQVCRISTPSYVTRPIDLSGRPSTNYHTQWRWYWEKDLVWNTFGNVIQAVIEKKYVHGQEVYRFESEVFSDAASKPVNQIFLLDFRLMTLTCISLPGSPRCLVRRRPLLYIGPAQVSCLEVTEHPFAEIPENWVPVDTTQDCELVPLNPESMEYHLVASELQRSIPAGRQICDVFRVQNPFLWHKFSSKRKFMEIKGRTLNECQLFHGTSDDMAVQAICKQNFDWRLCGKNNVAFGRGSYFAQDSAYSDRYSSQSQGVRWMFMARVLVGRYTKGNSTLVRPPPLDPTKPYGDLYDSCVDNAKSPKIYVIFDSDQCYPEYLISYRLPFNLPVIHDH